MKNRGFTLIELMIVVAIIGILAAIAVPKFAELIKKSREGALKGTLSSVRSALRVYYADNEAIYPAGPAGANITYLQSSLAPKYLNEWPSVHAAPYHPETATVDAISGGDPAAADSTDDGEWVYVSNRGSDEWGRINIECYHADLKGTAWSAH